MEANAESRRSVKFGKSTGKQAWLKTLIGNGEKIEQSNEKLKINNKQYKGVMFEAAFRECKHSLIIQAG